VAARRAEKTRTSSANQLRCSALAWRLLMDKARASMRPTIARIWRGRTTTAKADEYERHIYEEGIKPLEEKALAVQLLREIVQ
jgi:hypothetical protein